METALPGADGVELLEVVARHLRDGPAEVAALVDDQLDVQVAEAGYSLGLEVCVIAQEGLACGAWASEEGSEELPGEGDVVDGEDDVVEQERQEREQ